MELALKSTEYKTTNDQFIERRMNATLQPPGPNEHLALNFTRLREQHADLLVELDAFQEK